MSAEKCGHCPVAGRCTVQATGHVAHCDWAAAGGKWAAKVVEMSADLADDGRPDPPRPGVDETFAAIKLARTCPYRSKDMACGCNGFRCGIRPAGRQVVAGQACIECVTRYGV